MPGSGIYVTLGYAPESPWGTFAAPTHFLTVLKEGGEYKKTATQSKALHGGLYPLASRRAITKIAALQQIDLDIYDRGMGQLWANAIGASTVTGSTVFTQTFVPANTDGEGLSLQVGRPMTNDSTIQAVSYTGCKVTEWQIGAKGGELGTCNFSFDSKLEDSSQSFTAPSFVASNLLTAAETTLTLGGTASTSGGVTSVSGGTVASLANDVTIKGENKYNVDRYPLGTVNKLEQLSNDLRAVTGSVMLDFNDLTTAYNTFKSDATFAIQMVITGPIVASTTHSSVTVLLPACKWDADNFAAGGPEIIQEKLTFTALDDGVNNPVQVTLLTLDSAI